MVVAVAIYVIGHSKRNKMLFLKYFGGLGPLVELNNADAILIENCQAPSRDSQGAQKSDFLSRVNELASEIAKEQLEIKRISGQFTAEAELSTGFRLFNGAIQDDLVCLWLQTNDLLYCAILHKAENRQLADHTIRLVHKYAMQYKALQGVSSRPEKMASIINAFLPSGTLVFMNHRFVRMAEKQIEETLRKL